MFSSMHYVPVLTGKAGEYRALRQLSSDIKAGITPLIEVPPIPWDHENDAPSRTLDQHLAKTAENIECHWGNEAAVFVDLYCVEDEGSMPCDQHPVEFVLSDARSRGVHAIPVTGLERDANQHEAVAAVVSEDDRGVCLRLIADEIMDAADLDGDIESLLAALGVTPAGVDLLLDFGIMRPEFESTYRLASRTVLAVIPRIEEWRTLTMAGSAFPINMSGFPQEATSATPRTEWRIWRDLATNRAGLQRVPTFGDYSIDNPEYVDLDFRVIKMTANIRYTTDETWLLVKGRVINKGEESQYPGLARRLRELPQYSGRAFSWGDQQISDCAERTVGPGNATTWRLVATNHHLTFVVNQIASLPAL